MTVLEISQLIVYSKFPLSFNVKITLSNIIFFLFGDTSEKWYKGHVGAQSKASSTYLLKSTTVHANLNSFKDNDYSYMQGDYSHMSLFNANTPKILNTYIALSKWSSLYFSNHYVYYYSSADFSLKNESYFCIIITEWRCTFNQSICVKR